MSGLAKHNKSPIGPDGWDHEALARGNIMPTTGLATDYLNVFNEAVMLFGLLPEIPEMIDDLLAWQPLTYEQHFMRSSFAAKDLAIWAYEHMDPSVRHPFDALSHSLGAILLAAIAQAREMIATSTDISDFVGETNLAVQSAISMLDGMIHGGSVGGAQDDIDALFD
jgi:hypothetical protein